MIDKCKPNVDWVKNSFWLWIVLLSIIMVIPMLMYVANRTRIGFLNKLDSSATDELMLNVGYMQSQIENLNFVTRVISIGKPSKQLLTHPDDPVLREQINSYLSDNKEVSGNISYIMDANGQVLVAGNWDAPDSFIGKNYGFRPYFKTAMGGIPAQYLDIGVTSKKLGYYVAMPIKIEDRVAGVIVTKKDPQTLILPKVKTGHHFFMTDDTGIIVAADHQPFMFHTMESITQNKPADNRSEHPFRGMDVPPLTKKPIRSIQNIKLITIPTKFTEESQIPEFQQYVIKTSPIPYTKFNAHALIPVKGLNARLAQNLSIALIVVLLSVIVVGLILERWLLMKRIHSQSIRDPLTGLYTRLYMAESVGRWLAAHERGDIGGLSVAMFDLDHFKHINDIHGHVTGDHVLAQVAAVILKECRKSDMAIRYGGEEFLILIPSEGHSQVFQFAERIRGKIENLDMSSFGQTIKITLSGGTAAHQRGETLEQLITRVDSRLYLAKENGRNQIWLDD
jgi:diguanylate cyclase (GGDEF)-like protein